MTLQNDMLAAFTAIPKAIAMLEPDDLMAKALTVQQEAITKRLQAIPASDHATQLKLWAEANELLDDASNGIRYALAKAEQKSKRRDARLSELRIELLAAKSQLRTSDASNNDAKAFSELSKLVAGKVGIGAIPQAEIARKRLVELYNEEYGKMPVKAVQSPRAAKLKELMHEVMNIIREQEVNAQAITVLAEDLFALPSETVEKVQPLKGVSVADLYRAQGMDADDQSTKDEISRFRSRSKKIRNAKPIGKSGKEPLYTRADILNDYASFSDLSERAKIQLNRRLANYEREPSAQE